VKLDVADVADVGITPVYVYVIGVVIVVGIEIVIVSTLLGAEMPPDDAPT
jgi:hypothetical protein